MSSAAATTPISSPPAARETRHAMKLRHKAELKALLGAPAKGIGAKKKQKEDAAALELVHTEQLKELERREKEEKEGGDADGESKADGEATEAADSAPAAAASAAKQPSRAAKKKAAAIEKEKARAAELREQTKDMRDVRGEEDAAIARHIAKEAAQQKLHVREMVSDGHCLYRAIADQAHAHHLMRDLPLNDNVTPFVAMRQLAADYIDAHRDEFAAFLMPEDEQGNLVEMNDETWAKYLADLRSEEKAVWGGHNEVVALSKVLRRPIVIWSADGRMEVGEEFKQPATNIAPAAASATDASPSPVADHEPLHISFHKHYYGLGSHYNSVVPKEEEEEEEEATE